MKLQNPAIPYSMRTYKKSLSTQQQYVDWLNFNLKKYEKELESGDSKFTKKQLKSIIREVKVNRLEAEIAETQRAIVMYEDRIKHPPEWSHFYHVVRWQEIVKILKVKLRDLLDESREMDVYKSEYDELEELFLDEGEPL